MRTPLIAVAARLGVKGYAEASRRWSTAEGGCGTGIARACWCSRAMACGTGRARGSGWSGSQVGRAKGIYIWDARGAKGELSIASPDYTQQPRIPMTIPITIPVTTGTGPDRSGWHRQNESQGWFGRGPGFVPTSRGYAVAPLRGGGEYIFMMAGAKGNQVTGFRNQDSGFRDDNRNGRGRNIYMLYAGQRGNEYGVPNYSRITPNYQLESKVASGCLILPGIGMSPFNLSIHEVSAPRKPPS